MMKRKKVYIVICSVIALGIAVLLVQTSMTGNKTDPDFRWVLGNMEYSPVYLTTGKTVVVPFEFRVGGHVSEVSLLLEGDAVQQKGIVLEDTVVKAENGTVSSKVIFRLQPEATMRAGRYHVAVVASDAATQGIIRRGEIPYVLNMLDLIWKCSC